MTGTKPSHYLWIVEDRPDSTGDKATWHRIAAAWPQHDGKGLTIQLPPGVSVSGRLIIREHEEGKGRPGQREAPPLHYDTAASAGAARRLKHSG